LSHQTTLFSKKQVELNNISDKTKDDVAKFPSTRYQGSKFKICEWICDKVSDLEFDTYLDAFGGTGSIAYKFKQMGKQVTYNDLLRFNYYIGKALIENDSVKLNKEELDWIFEKHEDIEYPTFIYDNFHDIYFTDEENKWLDQVITNINHIENPYKYAIAFFSLCQSCIIKRPYNLFHRKNLYMRLSDVKRSFGNKKTWDKPFENWFTNFVEEANQAIFSNGKKNLALNLDAMDIQGNYDLVYIDTPYISGKGIGVDYHSFYHFLEGLTAYDQWHNHIDYNSKHRRLKPKKNCWTNKKEIYEAFDKLFDKYKDSILVISYRSDGIPSEDELKSLLEQYKDKVEVSHFGKYKYALSNNSKSKEILFVGE